MARLVGTATGSARSYVVRLPPGAMGDDETKRAAIVEHLRLTGWMEPVVLVARADLKRVAGALWAGVIEPNPYIPAGRSREARDDLLSWCR